MTLKGKSVVVYLQAPKERFWGILRELDASGAVVEGIELESFDSWVHEVARAGSGAAPPSLVFFPTSRIERILLDRSSRSIPSLEERFRGVTGRSLSSHLGAGRPVRPVPFRKD